VGRRAPRRGSRTTSSSRPASPAASSPSARWYRLRSSARGWSCRATPRRSTSTTATTRSNSRTARRCAAVRSPWRRAPSTEGSPSPTSTATRATACSTRRRRRKLSSAPATRWSSSAAGTRPDRQPSSCRRAAIASSSPAVTSRTSRASAATGRSSSRPSRPGIFAVGDVRSGSIKRVASAVGEGSTAVQLIHQRL
jgi:hypothetical protein